MIDRHSHTDTHRHQYLDRYPDAAELKSIFSRTLLLVGSATLCALAIILTVVIDTPLYLATNATREKCIRMGGEMVRVEASDIQWMCIRDKEILFKADRNLVAIDQ